VLRLHRDVAEGLQHEWLYTYDLPLRTVQQPQNQDGEVAGFQLMAVREAIELAAGEQMTVDAALVTLDFALRHSLLPADEAQRLLPRFAELRIAAAFNPCEVRDQPD
jgi:hypothetical protein